MFEVIVLFLLMSSIAAWYTLPSVFKSFQKFNAADHSAVSEKLKLPEDSVLRRHFITHWKSEIESALHLSPTDPVLQRHYNTLVTAESEASTGC